MPDVDRTLAEALQAMSDWLEFLEAKRAAYQEQLTRARAAAGVEDEPPTVASPAPVSSTAAPQAWQTWDGSEAEPWSEWKDWAQAAGVDAEDASGDAPVSAETADRSALDAWAAFSGNGNGAEPAETGADAAGAVEPAAEPSPGETEADAWLTAAPEPDEAVPTADADGRDEMDAWV